jgi:hypothetical protein
VTPAIGTASLVIPRDQDFTISWTPEGHGEDEVIFDLEQIGESTVLQCWCTVPDSTGHVTLASKLLMQFATDLTPSEGKSTLRLGRTTSSPVSSSNATVSLVGESLVTGNVTFQ